jgi:hypothetical protein
MSAPREFKVGDLVDGLRARGIAARVDHTGGGCFTVFAGPGWLDVDGDPRSAALAGPFYARDDVLLGDFVEGCTGPDDDGEDGAIYFADAGCRDLADVIDLVALQVAERGTLPDIDTLGHHGFDGSLRGFSRIDVAR